MVGQVGSELAGVRRRLLVRGSINIDEFFVVPHIVQSGETIASTNYSKRAGGKGANQAVSAAKAGAAVDFIGAIGNDGVWLDQALRDYGVGVVGLLKLDDQLTGRAVIQLSTSTSDNSIVLLPGANASLSSSLAPSSLRQPLSSYSHLLLQNEIPLASTIDWLEAASSEGVQIIYNPSPMPTKEQLSTFPWSKVDWLLTNEGEARELLGSTGQTQGEHYIKDLKRKLSTDEGKGPNIVVTKGENGMAVLFNGELVSCAAGEVVGGVKDTTGAGDCFTGYFATLLSSHPPTNSTQVHSILSIASQAAAMCVESEGAMESVPLVAAVRERLGKDSPSELGS